MQTILKGSKACEDMDTKLAKTKPMVQNPSLSDGLYDEIEKNKLEVNPLGIFKFKLPDDYAAESAAATSTTAKMRTHQNVYCIIITPTESYPDSRLVMGFNNILLQLNDYKILAALFRKNNSPSVKSEFEGAIERTLKSSIEFSHNRQLKEEEIQQLASKLLSYIPVVSNGILLVTLDEDLAKKFEDITSGILPYSINWRSAIDELINQQKISNSNKFKGISDRLLEASENRYESITNEEIQLFDPPKVSKTLRKPPKKDKSKKSKKKRK